MNNMSDFTEFELQQQAELKAHFPGMPEIDVQRMVKSFMALGLYPLGPDSLEKEGVPKGELIDGVLVSQLYPGSEHPYKIYVPANYDPLTPAPLMIFLDGISQYLSPLVNANVALDNLIHDGRIPAMIAVFIEPGNKGDGMPIWGGIYEDSNSNRSKEYDETDDLFSRFLLEELIPQLEKDWNISSDPEMRCICGASSGGQAAFNAAWHRPDAFRKVISHIGSFIAMRGGDCNPSRIRKNPPKPIRVFLQDGEQDVNVIYGDLVLANKTMASALEYRGYDYKYVFGRGGHNVEHAGAILPETLEWIWR